VEGYVGQPGSKPDWTITVGLKQAAQKELLRRRARAELARRQAANPANAPQDRNTASPTDGPWAKYQRQGQQAGADEGWWRSAPVVPAESANAASPEQPKTGPWTKFQGQQEPQETQPESSMPWGDVGSQALANIPSSAANLAGGLWQSVRHPLQTIDSAGALLSGGLGHMWNAVTPEAMNMTPGDDMALASQFADNIKQRYGGSENVKHTLATDPIGVLADASALLSGGAGAVAKLPGAAKFAAGVSKAADLSNPLLIAGKGLSAAGRGVGMAASYPLSLTSGVPARALQESLRTGLSGGEGASKFRAAMRGQDDLQGLVDETRNAIGTMAEKRSADYVKNMRDTLGSNAQVDLAPIRAELDGLRESLFVQPKQSLFGSAGQTGGNAQAFAPLSKASAAEVKVLDEIDGLLSQWEAHPEGRTPAALDGLKQRIDGLRPGPTADNADRIGRIVSTARDSVKRAIVDAVPGYRKAMDDYSSSMRLSDDVGKSLVGTERTGTDASINKLVSTLANPRRQKLMGELEPFGLKHAPARVAGHAVGQWTPRGTAKVVASAAAPAAWWLSPALLPALASSSPRLMGELMHAMGRAGRRVSQGASKLDPKALLLATLAGQHNGGRGW
jgi:hypothetical protein